MENKIVADNSKVNLSETEGKYLTFYSDGLFGVPIADVVQIVEMQKVTEVPSYPYYAKGVMNLRGSIIPVIDMRMRLSKPEAEYTDRTCVIVSNIRDRLFGFIVDAVDEVTKIEPEQISPPPRLSGEGGSNYLTGIARISESGSDEKIALLLDMAKILGAEEFEDLARAAM